MVRSESNAVIGAAPISTSDTTPDPVAQNPAGNESLTKLVSGILDDARAIARQQFEMLKAEVREDFSRSRQAAEFGATGIVFMTVGVLALVMALANFLHEYYQFSLWASWGITGMLFSTLGGACAATSYLLLNRYNPLPDKTFNALQENLSWKTEPKSRVS